MKLLLLIAALSVCVWPTDAFAGDLPAPDDHSGRVGAVSQSAEAPGAKAKVFIHPETGEILTYEQWQALGTQDSQGATATRPSQDDKGNESGGTVLEGRKVDLGNGDYVIVVDTPDSEGIETKVRFDENGKAHISCEH